MKNILKISVVSMLLPLVTHAQFTNTQGLITGIGNLVSSAIPVTAGLALLAFFWGLAKFIFRAGDESAQEEGKSIMKWGLIALFVMVSVWGIIRFFQRELGLNITNLPAGTPVSNPLIQA